MLLVKVDPALTRLWLRVSDARRRCRRPIADGFSLDEEDDDNGDDEVDGESDENDIVDDGDDGDDDDDDVDGKYETDVIDDDDDQVGEEEGECFFQRDIVVRCRPCGISF